ncbi:CRISPR-associated endoribonuclease Cas6 [Pyrobaculum sp. 3827-6]|uniref:CRISPR-associated endoribonuclease Cas6 n=1 Tax=Pyrobaculum sp. 3827-6 TaxID=2983604 RepID=UPI0021D9730C|nr:CRISPR-associated endoribonuclease Cas6 [Pyrobaculum sp. 3827-6]MCU7786875.1 CRISPR-associated endoribonuclease Cas6 [Pyrobaculum sp. 3827-6]
MLFIGGVFFCVWRVWVRGRLMEGAAVSGFSGTLVLSIVLSVLGRGDLHDARPKPFAVSPLFAGGRPVLDAAALPAGELVEFRVGFAQRGLAEAFVDGVARGFRIFNSRVAVEEVEFRDVSMDPLPGARCFRLEFLSPVRFAVRPLYRRRRALFDFTPRPLNVFKSVVRHGRALGVLDLGAPFLRWVYTYVGLADFGCFGRCVRTVSLLGGGVARGFTGWAVYRVFGRRRLGDVWRALRVAEVFNVGTGRGMGLGAVKVEPRDCG